MLCEALLLFRSFNKGVEVGGVDVVVYVAVVVRNAGVLGREAPLPVDNELVLVDSSWQLLYRYRGTMVMENSSPCFSRGVDFFQP